jgi:hypothetical protein
MSGIRDIQFLLAERYHWSDDQIDRKPAHEIRALMRRIDDARREEYNRRQQDIAARLRRGKR